MYLNRPEARRRRDAFIAALIGGAALLVPVPASAGTYEALSCDAAPAGGADSAWGVYDDSDGGRTNVKNCPSNADLNRGYHSSQYSRNNNGTYVGREFRAPSGTTLVKWEGRMRGYVNNEGNQCSGLFRARDRSAPLYGTCGGGSYGVGPTGSAAAVALPPGSTQVFAGVFCGSARQCNQDPGSSSAEHWMYAAKVTVEDPVKPTISEAGGTQADPAAERGTSSYRFTASDNVGIREARLLIDGVEKDRETNACDFSAPIPCPNQAEKELSFDTKGVPDGSRHARVEVLDAAGNESSSERTLTVANGVAGAGGDSSREEDRIAVAGQTALSALVTLRSSKRSVRNGKRLMFLGRVSAGEAPVARVLVALQARVGRKWVTFRTVRTDERGLFGARYRFTRTFRTRSYTFRARLSAQAGVETDSDSPRVRVRVRGG
jgi:hypothetical protein